jgi:hypothetical protein
MELLVAGTGADLLERLPPAPVVAAVDEERRPRGGERAREPATEAIRRPRDEDRLLVERSDRAIIPLRAR